MNALKEAIEGHPCAGKLDLQTMPCLFACTRFCTVNLRAPGKVGYVLGDFSADPQEAKALLDYAGHYIDSAEGIVPYSNWPDGVKGHFIVRTPPEGFTMEPG